MKKIKVAQIGVKHDHAPAAFKSITHLTDEFEVVGFATENPDDTVGDVYASYPRMTPEEILAIPDLDAVVIETSELNLAKYALMAAERGLAIQMDKPGGIELADFEKLIATVKEKKLVFHTGYMYRYNPAVVKAREMVRNGEIGEICSVEAQMNCYHKAQKRQWLDQFPGGMMFFLGCHLVDLILQFQGVPEKIIPFNTCSGFDGVTANDIGMAVFQYKNGISFAKSAATECCGFMRRQLVISGSKGTIEINPIEEYISDAPFDNHQVTMRISTDKTVEKGITSWKTIGAWEHISPFDRYDNMMRAFAAMVRGDATNPWDYDYELTVYKHVLAACGK